MKIGFIGAGNMATAIIKGYLPNTEDEIAVFDIDEAKMDNLVALGASKVASAEELAENSDYLVLAVKPQSFSAIMDELRGHIKGNTVVISIAAGITSTYLKSELGEQLKVVRVMPNTPLLLGYGASALARVEPCTEEEFQHVCKMFQSSGEIAVISEEKMNEIITINGSSPAYLYLLAEYFIHYAVEQGISEEVAKKLFAQTMIGSAKMITDSGYSLEQLIQMVSSKGGTTIAGLDALRENHLEETVFRACEACTKRAYELAK